jgi:hypothetical protein
VAVITAEFASQGILLVVLVRIEMFMDEQEIVGFDIIKEREAMHPAELLAITV